MISIDFETRSECDLKAHGSAVYAEHPTTEILCLAYSLGPNEPVEVWYPGADEPVELFAAIERGDEISAFNTSFERALWPRMVELYGAPDVPFEQWVCSAAEARAVALPRNLAQAADALGLDVKKDRTGYGLMMKMCKPQKSGPKWHGGPAELARLGEYCRRDVETEVALSAELPELSNDERAIWQADQRINERGFRIDRPAVEAMVRMIQDLEVAAMAELAELTDGAVTTAGQLARIIHFAAQYFLELPDLTQATVETALARPDLAPELRRVLTIRQQFGRSSTKKFQAFLDRASADDRIRGSFLYAGAGRTRRWSGKGVQPQNFKRGFKDPELVEAVIECVLEADSELLSILFGDAMEAGSNVIRGMIIPADGSEFVVADYASVEARVLAMLAHDQPMAKMFREGVDPYVEMAASIFEVPFEAVTSSQRMLGKIAILGLGYGMGPTRFAEQCASYGAPVEPAFAARVVRLYRKRRKPVVALWNQMQADAIDTIQGKAEPHRVGYDMKLDGSSLVVALRSGSVRYYRDVALEVEDREGRASYSIVYYGLGTAEAWLKQRTYGGKLVENLVQATARDLLADALVELDKRGLPVVMHAHDEIVVEAPIGTVEPDELARIMCTSSPWAKTWPIAAEAWKGARYRK